MLSVVTPKSDDSSSSLYAPCSFVNHYRMLPKWHMNSARDKIPEDHVSVDIV
jgi:hypothetical protein